MKNINSSGIDKEKKKRLPSGMCKNRTTPSFSFFFFFFFFTQESIAYQNASKTPFLFFSYPLFASYTYQVGLFMWILLATVQCLFSY
jgi:cellulose synthase/poly-beta-1,6-N-acetylglucosamine synthase-like glycosyltransferase